MLEIDTADEETIIKAAKQYGNQKLDILVNVAGSYFLKYSVQCHIWITNLKNRNL